MNAETNPIHASLDAPASIGKDDRAMILAGLARINDPMLTYFIAMALDRAAGLLPSRGGTTPPGPEKVISNDPCGVSYSSEPPQGPW